MPKQQLNLTIGQFQRKLERYYPNENLIALSYDKIGFCFVRCETCGRVYHHKASVFLNDKRKPIICPHCASS